MLCMLCMPCRWPLKGQCAPARAFNAALSGVALMQHQYCCNTGLPLSSAVARHLHSSHSLIFSTLQTSPGSRCRLITGQPTNCLHHGQRRAPRCHTSRLRAPAHCQATWSSTYAIAEDRRSMEGVERGRLGRCTALRTLPVLRGLADAQTRGGGGGGAARARGGCRASAS
jgi:hypothetical protein